MKDKIELASWIFAGNIGLISFLSLFVAFVYDNKHIEASRVLRQYYKPYGLSYEVVKTSLNDYSTYVNKGIMLSIIHGLLTLTSIASITIWGVAVTAYTENRLFLFFSLDKEILMNQGIYLFWFILCLLLLGIVIFVNLIRLNKNPVSKGFLPKLKQIYDINFLVKQDADVNEIIFVTAPRIDIYRNHEIGDTPSYEFNIIFPIGFENMRFMVKLFNNEELVFRGYGKLSRVTGDRVLLGDTDFINDLIFNKLDISSRIELKVYDGDSKMRAKLSYTVSVDNNKVSYLVDKQLRNIQGRDIDEGIIKSISESDKLTFQNDLITD
ncbi:hypothetical protein [Paenibacillus lutimineralis]|nr:hypothetical protein [Paenibacillus lutimineralis]